MTSTDKEAMLWRALNSDVKDALWFEDAARDYLEFSSACNDAARMVR